MAQHDVEALQRILNEAQASAHHIRDLAYALQDRLSPPLETVTLVTTLEDARGQLGRFLADRP